MSAVRGDCARQARCGSVARIGPVDVIVQYAHVAVDSRQSVNTIASR